VSNPSILCIGVGNSYRHDDAVGLVVARELQTRHFAGVSVIETSGEGAALLEAWSTAEMVFLIDAVASGSPPGTIFRLDAGQQSVPTGFFHYSTHAFSVAEAIELARVLDQLPPHLIVYGIEGQDFSVGQGLSAQVASAMQQVIFSITQELNALPGQRSTSPAFSNHIETNIV
jgi:hydrogenase maturation protease